VAAIGAGKGIGLRGTEEEERGRLLIIGGNEDKTGERQILRRFVEMAGGRKANLAVITTAAEAPQRAGEEYSAIFRELGAADVFVPPVSTREAANSAAHAADIEAATGIFFTGGDQLRLTSILGGTMAGAAIKRAFAGGAVIAGTSAGASVMSETMIVGGEAAESPKKSGLSLAHGMGLIAGVIIDQHFAQRGRLNRLLEAVAQNPNVLGLGIDEDTALAVSKGVRCTVIGSRTVTVVDGRMIRFSNISESEPREPLAITNVILHILPPGFGFDLSRRIPYQEDGFK